jgi:MAF protein
LINKQRLILASNSPRRKHLLSLGGWDFEVFPADVDETPLPGEKPDHYVLRVAEQKARRVKRDYPRGSIILAADTTVAHQGKILGKPVDEEDARQTLINLRNQSHHVYTGISIYDPVYDKFLTDLATTAVPMRNYSDEEIEAYILTGDPFDKAGSYAIQHSEFHPVDNLAGCYANVVGLPLCHLLRTFTKIGLPSLTDLPQACQKDLSFDCSVSEKVLRGVL